MNLVQDKILQAINQSIFLDLKRKEKLRILLEKLDAKSAKELLQVLKIEKTSLKNILKNFFQEKGQKALEILNELFQKGKSKTLQANESKSKKEEVEKMNQLLRNLE